VVVEHLVRVEGGQVREVDSMAKTGEGVSSRMDGWMDVREIKATYPWSITLCVLAARPMLGFDGHQLRDLAIPWRH